MAAIRPTRQRAIMADADIVQQLCDAAKARWHIPPHQHPSPSTLWTLRCMWGCLGILPFMTGMACQNLAEVRWVYTQLLSTREDQHAKEAAEAPRIASRRREAARIRQRRRQH